MAALNYNFTAMKVLTSFFERLLRIRPEDNVPSDVAGKFKHNVIVNTLDVSLFYLADSFWSVNTIMPVFAATLTDSPLLIGLIPAVVNAGWFIPQLFMSGHISKLPKVLPTSMKFGFLERVPYIFLPLLTLLIGRIDNLQVYWLFFLIMVWRGIGAGMSGLPWQEIIARVIPHHAPGAIHWSIACVCPAYRGALVLYYPFTC